jgi:hydrophobe/amphiphile efflux-3 (HAE3) family protein
MTQLRNRIETWFEGFAHVVCRNRIKTIAIMLAMLIALIVQIPRITVDTSIEGLLHDEDPAMLTYNAFRDQFGRDEVVIIAINPSNIFDLEFLKKLKALHEKLEDNVPHIDDITSLINARNTRGEIDELIVEDLLENWPKTESDMADLKARVLANQIYKNLLISEDGRLTTIIMQTHSHSTLEDEAELLEGFKDSTTQDQSSEDAGNADKTVYLTDQENSEAVNAVYKIVQEYHAPDFPIYVAGSPAVTHFLKQFMMRDMRRFMALAVLMVALLLFVMFRRISGVFLPLGIVILSLLATLGIMAIFGVAIKLPTQILPSFLLAVGVGTSVHILAIFYHRFGKIGDKQDAIAYALGHSGLAIVMTNVTTACGLLSFSTADIAPIADLGVFAGIGVLLTFINTIVLLPALLALMPLKSRKSKTTSTVERKSFMDRFLEEVSRFSTTHVRSILLFSGIVIALSVAALTRIQFSHDPLGWYPTKNPIRMATEKIDRELRGSLNLEVVIDTGRENGLYEPELLNRIEKAVAYVESLESSDIYAGKAWSLTAILKEIHQALNENRHQYYVVPQNRDLIAQEFLLFENTGSDDLEDVVDSQFSMTRFTIKAPFKDAVKYDQFLNNVEKYFKVHFPEAKITITGMMVLLFQTISNVMISMAKSYAIALVVITVLMIFLIGKVRIGLLSMIPNIAPILLMLGIVGAFSIPMDLFTMMVASIAIGLAVDDTIHFMHNFRRYYEADGDPKTAVRETLDSTGRAMLVTSIVLSLGFFIFVFATMNNLINFGLLTAFTIMMALVSDFLIAPALMVLVNKPRNTQESETTGG